MKKYLMLFLLVSIVFSMASCGGSGSGSSSSPPGGDPNVAFYVKLRPSHIIAQTNTSIYFHARVINREGNPIPNVPVYFTNVSPIGTFDVNPPVVNTDQYGYATVKLLSTTEGFATIQAEVNTGSGQVRDRRTVFFSIYSLVLLPRMELEVDGDNDGTYDEDNDFILFQTTTDNQVIVRATVYDRYGQLVSGSAVIFGADWPYRVGSETTCSDGGTSCEVWFPLGNTATTDIDGEALVLVQVDPIILRTIQTVLNITALADNGATGMVSLFLLPVSVSTVTLSANPAVVEPEGTSAITAAVLLNTGGPAPDGTTMSFTTTCGSVTPFAQTTDGVAEAEFTAPATPGTCTITGRVGTVSGTTTVTVTTALAVLPTTQTRSTGALPVTTGPYTIFGGIPPYTIFTSNATFPANPTTVATSGGTFTVTVPANSCAGTVTYTIRDSAGDTVTATLTITSSAPPLTSTLVPATICENDALCAALTETATLTIAGGSPPYNTVSNNPAVIPNPGAGNSFTIDAVDSSITANTSVVLSITDSCSATSQQTVQITNQ